MTGPAISGLVIAAVGTGWASVINGVSFVAVLISLSTLRVSGCIHTRGRGSPPDAPPRVSATSGRVGSANDPDHAVPDRHLRAQLPDLHLDVAVGVFHADARGYGLSSSIMAIGTVTGTLLSACRQRLGFTVLLTGAGPFGLGCTLAAALQAIGRSWPHSSSSALQP